MKALETYHIVFTRISSARLAADLPIYAGGLFPLLSHCSTSLKPPLLSLYETHFLPLGPKLAPILDGLILALLPGLEDETSEFYSRSRTLLDKLDLVVDDVNLFSQAIWRALLQSPPVRCSAARYLRSKLSAADEAMRAQLLSDMPLVAFAITAALSDTDALTQRSVLDLLVSELSLDAPFFSAQDPDQRDAAIALVGGVFGTLLRRDVSLTKRVHLWLLGGKERDAGVEFCNNFSKLLILPAIDNVISTVLDSVHPADSKIATRPCKIVLALTDRVELCDCLGHQLALRMLDFGRRAVTQVHPNASEIGTAIADFLHDLGSARVFAELEHMLSAGKQTTFRDFELLSYSLSMFPTKDHVVRRRHLPALLKVAIQSLNAISAEVHVLDKAVDFCSKAMSAIGLCRDLDVDGTLREDIKRIASVFASFFVAWLAHFVQAAPPELRRSYSDVTVVDEYAAEVQMASMHEVQQEVIRIAKNSCTFFVSVATSGIDGSVSESIALHATAKCASSADIRISLAGARAFADVSRNTERSIYEPADDGEQVMGVIRRCWRQMHPSLRTATAQSAQTLLALQQRYQEEVRIVIADGILSPILSRRLRNLERFACLWRLSVEHRLLPLPLDNGLFLMLDTLTDEHWGPKMLARSWLSDAFEVDAASVVDAPLRMLLCQESRTVGHNHEFSSVYDAPQVLYAFQTMRSILESCPTVLGSGNEQSSASLSIPRKGTGRDRSGVRALAMTTPSPRTAQALATVFAVQSSVMEPSNGSVVTTVSPGDGDIALAHLLPAHNYVVTIALTCLGYLRGRVPSKFRQNYSEKGAVVNASPNSESGDVEFSEDDEDLMWTLGGLGSKSMVELHESVCAAAAECLATLLTAIPVPSQMSSVLANSFAAPLLTLINRTVGAVDPVLQLHFLNAMSFLVTADGPSYLSSLLGKEMFMGPKTGRRRPSYPESRMQPQSSRPSNHGSRGVQLGATESLDAFVPWFLSGVASACRNEHSKPDSGSQEVLGVRRRWIQFTDTALKHIGISLPVVTEGLLIIFIELLEKARLDSHAEFLSGDSEFSRVDETLVLLEGLLGVVSNVMWSFEHALASNDLRDGSLVTSEQTLEQPTRSMPALQSKERENNSQLDSRLSGSSMSIVQPPPIGEIAPSAERSLADRASSMTNATSAVINALNPLRMINEFVKDVLTGGGSDNTHRLLDPRRSAARLLFGTLPDIVINIAYVWGPSSNGRARVEHGSDDTERAGIPRLSMELPRERRQAQRASVLSILEPIFELRPVDAVASITAIVYKEQDEFGSLDLVSEKDSVSKMACYMLHGVDSASADAVVGCIRTLFDKANKWDIHSSEAKEGRAQSALRRHSVEKLKATVNQPPHGNDMDISMVGKCAANDFNSPIPGGVTGIDFSFNASSNTNGVSAKHDVLFHWGDYFAQYSPEFMEVACLNFLDSFLFTCTDGYDVQGAWSSLFPLLRDAVATCRFKAAIPAILRVLNTFVSKSPSPFPDRRVRREIMVVASLAISACTSVAGGMSDVSLAEHKNIHLFKKKLSIIALRSLAMSVSNLVESAFLDDKPQLLSSVSSCLTPAISTLKKAAARSAAIYNTSSNPRRSQGVECSPRHETETAVDLDACEAAALVILDVSGKDWGMKIVRREVLVLLEDPNFFFGKNREVLRLMSTIVKEVVAAGGASFLLSSLGTLSANTTPGLPSLFIGRDSETLLRSRAIHRITFCVFVSEPDFYSPQMPFIFERIRDALRMTDTAMVAECLFCLRALLLRTGPSSISAFRATILSEIFRILRSPNEDLSATMSVLRFLDLITLLSPPDYGYERCFFFGYKADVIDGGPLPGEVEILKDEKPEPSFIPYIRNVSKLWTVKHRTIDEVFKAPFRLEPGKTVLGGSILLEIDSSFVGQYATALMARNSMPKMKASTPDRLCLSEDFESEFLQFPIS